MASGASRVAALPQGLHREFGQPRFAAEDRSAAGYVHQQAFGRIGFFEGGVRPELLTRQRQLPKGCAIGTGIVRLEVDRRLRPRQRLRLRQRHARHQAALGGFH